MKDSPSLTAKTADVFARAYADARKTASVETGIPPKTFSENLPFTYAQATDETFWPGRSIDDRD